LHAIAAQTNLNQSAMSNSQNIQKALMEQQFIISNIKSILKNINAEK